MAWPTQSAGVIVVGSIYAQFLNFVFGACWLFIFIVEDITKDVAGFSNVITTIKDEDRSKLTERFCHIVQIFSDAKQYRLEFEQLGDYI